MLVEKQTKYSIGDIVYAIYNGPKYNDYYSTDTWWRVIEEDMQRKPQRLRVSAIDIEVREVSRKIKNVSGLQEIRKEVDIDENYQLEGYTEWFKSSRLFKTVEEAEEECKRLNGE